MTDPIADFLTRLRNALRAQHQDVTIPSSKLKRELARILKEQGYIEGYDVRPAALGHPGEQIIVTLKYTRRSQARDLRDRARLAPRPRTYVDHAHIPRIQGGMGTAIISTSQRSDDRPRGAPGGCRRRGRGSQVW